GRKDAPDRRSGWLYGLEALTTGSPLSRDPPTPGGNARCFHDMSRGVLRTLPLETCQDSQLGVQRRACFLDPVRQRAGENLLRRKYDEQARVVQVQTRSPYGRKHLGSSQVPGQPSRIRPRPARPAPQGQAFRLRRAAARQAEAEGLLRR